MSKVKQFTYQFMPLTPPIFYILLSLATSSRHGYDIMKQVKEDSHGKIVLGPGTLYGAIKRLLDEKLICESSVDGRRRYYALTEKGKNCLSVELQRYSEAVVTAQKKQFSFVYGLS